MDAFWAGYWTGVFAMWCYWALAEAGLFDWIGG